MTARLTGLVAATHTPFDAAGALHLAAVEKQAEHLARTGVAAAFIGGTTGEGASLTVDERLRLADRWAAALKGSPLRLIVHVGANCLADARALAAQAVQLNAAAVSALAPSYFKPADVESLVLCCADIAAAAPNTPFYYYDIPSLTNIRLSNPAFLAAADGRIPTLAGIKFSNPDLMQYQQCLRFAGGKYDIPWGTDEYLLAALAVGAAGGVGSTYNFAAPLYATMIAAFARGDLPTARNEQYRSVQLVELLSRFGYMAAAKATMDYLGVPVGPPRLPHRPLTAAQESALRAGLEAFGL